jgi:hypothetical protein
MNRQEIFNQAYLGLKSQGFQKSISIQSGSCSYRGKQDTKCAVGHLMLDEEYSPSYEGLNASSLVARCFDEKKYPKLHSFFERIGLDFGNPLDSMFLYGLQNAHDDADIDDDGENLKKRLKNFADRYKLTIPEE